MSTVHRARFAGDMASVEALTEQLPDLMVEPSESGFWLSGSSLVLGPGRDLFREQLEAFSRSANAIIALVSPYLQRSTHMEQSSASRMVEGSFSVLPSRRG